jgi:hypothetical protein
MKINSDTKWEIFLGILIVLIGVLYIGNNFVNWSSETSGDIDITYDQAESLLRNSNSFIVKGDLDKWIQKPSVWVGDEYIGNLRDKGILDWQIIFLIGKDEVFNISYGDTGDSAPKLCTTGNYTSTRYAYHYADNESAGYAEKTSIKLNDGSEWYAYFFYDADLKRKKYFYPTKDGWSIYSTAGKLLVDADYTYNSFTNEYVITVTSLDNGVDLKDKIFLCSMVMASIEGNHNQG